MAKNDSVSLTVENALKEEDVGAEIARISDEAMRELGVRSGDVIEIEGRSKTYAIVRRSYIAGYEDTIFIDGNLRRDAGLGRYEQAAVRNAQAKPAVKIEVEVQQVSGEANPADLERLIVSRLQDRPLLEGKVYRIPTGPSFDRLFREFRFGFGMEFDIPATDIVVGITSVEPKGVAFITDKTKVDIRPLRTRERPRGKETVPSREQEKSSLPDVHYEDIGGLDRELQLVQEMIELPLRNPELFDKLGIEPPKGVLLYGPPGTGKTLIAKAVANEANAHFISISGPEIMDKYYGASEENLRKIFEEAQEKAPSIIFIDEIDSIAPKREETKGEVERRVVAQLLSLMDGLKSRGRVIVIAATNLPDNIDPALRRGGRFDREIEIGIPDAKGRLKIFQIHSRKVPIDLGEITLPQEKVTDDEQKAISRIEGELAELEKREKGHENEIRDLRDQLNDLLNGIKKRIFLQGFAEKTHGFVGADINLAVKESAMHALRSILKKVNPKDLKAGKIDKKLVADLKVTKHDFEEALKTVEPSAMREVLVEVPDVGWKDVGGLEDVKQDLREAVEWPLKYPELFGKLGTAPPKGILLFGPPGTGKTLIAKAVAHETECNFISVKGPELLSKWVGESEKGVREIFRKARQASPSIIFFDEIDALVPKRGTYAGSAHVTESVVSQILTELDGLEELKNVIVLGATNRPELLDDALMRPGRLDRVIYVPPPDMESRRKIFAVYLENAPGILAEDIRVDELVDKTEGYVGADIAALVREAKLGAMREFIALMGDKPEKERLEAIQNVRITRRHFDEALQRVRGSLDPEAAREAEQKSWEMIYPPEQRTILREAATTLERTAIMIQAPELQKDLEEVRSRLQKLTFARKKDFAAIRTGIK
ncbi:MAG: CDC48 family AAA ATPase, partial [Methanoregulaceae archaeon]|nr:CDC48 family AAA ATPase [Methanoregulaceae archaeon]